MEPMLLIVRSVTLGQRGKELLSASGIPAALLRSPRQYAPAGCAYALRLHERDAARAVRLLRRAEIPFTGPYPEPEGRGRGRP